MQKNAYLQKSCIAVIFLKSSIFSAKLKPCIMENLSNLFV